MLAESLATQCLERYGLAGTVLATTLGEALGGINFRHPLAHVDPAYDRLSPVYLADYATADDGTGLVHSSPAYGVEDFNSCVARWQAFQMFMPPNSASSGAYWPLPCTGLRMSS